MTLCFALGQGIAGPGTPYPSPRSSTYLPLGEFIGGSDFLKQ